MGDASHLCLPVNSSIVSWLRNESNIWQENIEEPSLLPSADHWLFIPTTVTVWCFADYKTEFMITYSAHEFRRCYSNLITKMSTSLNLQMWNINYTIRYYREVSQHSTNRSSSSNSIVGLKRYPVQASVCASAADINTSDRLSCQALLALIPLCRVSHLKTVPSNDDDSCRRMRGSENMIWELT
jgi:hypothetical protein